MPNHTTTRERLQKKLKDREEAATTHGNAKSTECINDVTYLHAQRIVRKLDERRMNVVSRLRSLSKQDLLSEAKSLTSQLYADLDPLTAALCASWDYCRLIRTADQPPYSFVTTRFAPAFSHVFQALRHSLRDATNDLSDALCNMLTAALRCPQEQMLSYWQNVHISAPLASALKAYLTLAVPQHHDNIRALCLFRPSLLADIYGVDAEQQALIDVGTILGDFINIPAVAIVDATESTIASFSKQSGFSLSDEDALFQHIAQQASYIFDIDLALIRGLKEFNLESVMRLQRHIRPDMQKSLKRLMKLTEDPKSIVHHVHRDLQPLWHQYNTGTFKLDLQASFREGVGALIQKLLAAAGHSRTAEELNGIFNLFMPPNNPATEKADNGDTATAAA